MMRDKLGLFGEDKDDLKLIKNLLNWMQSNQADYTNTFCYLMNINFIQDQIYKNKDFINWSKIWEKRILINGGTKQNSLELMKKNNPIIIPRNHKVEEVLEAANNNDLNPMNILLSILKKPYENQSNIENFQVPSNNENYQTFCGT
jgi:uncharacterized protein YdiU (UPF0061 family)